MVTLPFTIGTVAGLLRRELRVGDVVRLEVDEGVGTIWLERPPVNAINTALTAELHDAAREVSARSDIRAVVLTGGRKVFAAGADISEMAELGYVEMTGHIGRLQAALDAVAAIPKPVVAAVNGYALGGGCELALCADLRVAGDNARFGQPEILLGVVPGAGGTQRLPRLVGLSRAKDIIFTGRQVDAQEAQSIGLADRVVPADDVLPTALDLARRLAKGPAAALRAAKLAIDTGIETDLAAGLRMEAELFAALFATEDQKSGMASFLANGPGKAEFVGR